MESPAPQVRTLANAPHYRWGEDCDGWYLLQSPSLTVIRERMPPGSAEKMHVHSAVQQVFYILEGTATFQLNENTFRVQAHESIHVPAGTAHRVVNEGEQDLHFLLVSEPDSHQDRTLV